jgi:spore coat polysaccharide biosynthesis predicted glycosyltransferase SpsG
MAAGRSRGSGVQPVPCILFRVAAGPRIGMGHLIRSLRLASLSGVASAISVRGSGSSLRPAPLASFNVVSSGLEEAFDRARPSLLVVDDPSECAGEPWLTHARRRKCPVIGVVDAGIGSTGADLVIDGSVAASGRACAARRAVRGPEFAVVDPAIVRRRAGRQGDRRPPAERIFISFGGGSRAAYARRLTHALRAAGCRTPIVVAGGFGRARSRSDLAKIRWLGPQRTLVPWLSLATVAIVAGGITLYEACALGVPTIAIPIVPLQQPAVRAMTRLGGVVGVCPTRAIPPSVERVAARVVALLRSRDARRRVAARAAALVDGNGPLRVARLLRRVAGGVAVSEALAESRSLMRSGWTR